MTQLSDREAESPLRQSLPAPRPSRRPPFRRPGCAHRRACVWSPRTSTSRATRQRNLATFVTTWMEPEAQRIIAENLHRNFIDHAEYPISAEIEQRCVRMLADLFHAPGRDDGVSHPGVVRGDHARRPVAEVEVEGAPPGGVRLSTDRPNLVFGADVHVVWEKFCRYFDVEPRIVPSRGGQVHDRPRRRGSRTSTRTRSGWSASAAPRSPGTWTTSSGSTSCCST